MIRWGRGEAKRGGAARAAEGSLASPHDGLLRASDGRARHTKFSILLVHTAPLGPNSQPDRLCSFLADLLTIPIGTAC